MRMRRQSQSGAAAGALGHPPQAMFFPLSHATCKVEPLHGSQTVTSTFPSPLNSPEVNIIINIICLINTLAE